MQLVTELCPSIWPVPCPCPVLLPATFMQLCAVHAFALHPVFFLPPAAASTPVAAPVPALVCPGSNCVLHLPAHPCFGPCRCPYFWSCPFLEGCFCPCQPVTCPQLCNMSSLPFNRLTSHNRPTKCLYVLSWILQEKEDAKKQKQKARERMQPKMGRMDIDYQVRLWCHTF